MITVNTTALLCGLAWAAVVLPVGMFRRNIGQTEVGDCILGIFAASMIYDSAHTAEYMYFNGVAKHNLSGEQLTFIGVGCFTIGFIAAIELFKITKRLLKDN